MGRKDDQAKADGKEKEKRKYRFLHSFFCNKRVVGVDKDRLVYRSTNNLSA